MELCTKIKDAQGYKYRRFQWPRAWRMAFTGKGKRVLPVGMNVWIYSLLLALALAVPALASLPSSVVVSGSPTAADNNTYVLYSSADSAGNGYYIPQSGTLIYLYLAQLGNGSYYWAFSSAIDSTHPDYYSTASVSSTTSPVGYTFTGGSGGGSIVVSLPAAAPAPAPTVSSLAVSPSSLTGSSSSGQTVTLLVTLSAAAPTGGATVTFSSTTAGGFSGNVGFTTQLTVPYGSTSASESATIGASSSGGSVSFAAAYNSTSQSATVTVGAPAAATAGPFYVTGAGLAAVNGTYTQNGTFQGEPNFSGPNGYCLTYYASSWVIYLPGAEYVYALSASSSFSSVPGSYPPVNGNTGANAIVSLSSSGGSSGGGSGGSSGSGALVITPGPGVGGAVSTGTVTISAAQSAAIIVTLTSTAPTVASVPASVTIPAGSTSATFPVTCGSLAVSGFTTVSATISGGSSTSVIYSVNPASGGASGLLPDGQSTFTDGTGFASGFPASGFTPPTLPVVPTLPGVAMPTMPTFSLPGIPALGLPGDLKIGIPGIGSIGIPTGWLSKIVQYAAEAANISTGMTGAVLTAGMQYAAQGTSLAVYNAGAALHNDNVANAAAAHADATATVNANAQNTQAVQSTLNNNAAALETEESQNTLTLVSTTNTNFTNMLTSGPGGLLTQLFQYLFIPDQGTISSLTNTVQQFLNWGPYQLVSQVQGVLAAPTGQLAGAPVLPFSSQAPTMNTQSADLTRPRALARPSGRAAGAMSVTPVYGLPLPPANTDLAIPLMVPVQGVTYGVGASGVTATPNVTWTNSGQSVGFDFTPMTGSKFWPFFRLLEGASVWIVWLLGTVKRLMPRQVF